MAVAWIGNRDATVEQATQRAAELLMQSRCPVFSLDGDVHAWRSAIALAECVGGAYDQMNGADLAREVALFTDKGAMTVAPGEVRRRGDCVVVVGDVTDEHWPWLTDLAASTPDLSDGPRRFFHIPAQAGQAARRLARLKPTVLTCGGSAGATLAVLRAQRLGRAAGLPVRNFVTFEKALAQAAFTVFLYSGASLDELAAEMLQGLVADLNRSQRASTLLLASSDDAWGGALASTWMTGFAPRTGFGCGMPQYDPWRFDVERMIAEDEADLHVIMHACRSPVGLLPRRRRTVVLACTDGAVPNAAVTVAIGEPGIDHDAVRYSSRVGTIVAAAAAKPSNLPDASTVIRMIAAHLAHEAALSC